MSEADESIPESERPTLKFPVGEDLLPGQGAKEVEDVSTNPGPELEKRVPEPLEPGVRTATSNPGPIREALEKEVGVYLNPGPVDRDVIEPLPKPEPVVIPDPPQAGDTPKTNPGPPQS